MKKPVQEAKVTYETACLAKELGFDEICFYHFGSDKSEFESRNPNGSRNSQWAKCVARPTQAHLQAWLRDNHNIHLNSINIQNSDDYEVWITRQPGHFITNIDHREPYNVIINIGLQEALKILKEAVVSKI